MVELVHKMGGTNGGPLCSAQKGYIAVMNAKVTCVFCQLRMWHDRKEGA